MQANPELRVNLNLSDRFVDSSRAYQGGGGGLSDAEVMDLHRIGSGGLLPDLTLLVEVSPETAAHRLALRDAGNADRIGGRDAAYHSKVAAAFARLKPWAKRSTKLTSNAPSCNLRHPAESRPTSNRSALASNRCLNA